jgi:hypothetical protein
MKKLNGNWRDLFNGFSVALDMKKMLVGFVLLSLYLVILVVVPVYVAYKVNPTLPSLKEAPDLGKLYIRAIKTLLAGDTWKVVVFFTVLYLALVAVWGYCGGVVSRIAAVNLTKDEGLELTKALSFANKKFLSLFLPFVLPLLGFLFFFACNVVGGLVGRIPYAGEILVSIFLPLAVLSGFIMVFIMLGFVFGKQLFIPTIAVESSDTFDAVSRTFQYIYSEPWHYLWYNLVAIGYGVICIAFIWLFGGGMIKLGLHAVGVGMGVKFYEIISLFPGALITHQISGFVMLVWLVIIAGLIISYGISYLISSYTIIYLLMRKKVDDIEMQELYEEEAQPTLPQDTTQATSPTTPTDVSVPPMTT